MTDIFIKSTDEALRDLLELLERKPDVEFEQSKGLYEAIEQAPVSSLIH